jgi:predicted Zn-dependent protease with MMP-like domain
VPIGPEPDGTPPMEDLFPPDTARFATLVEAAVAQLPDPFRAEARKVVVRIEDFPPDDLWQEMGCETPYELTGLYEGIPLTEKSFSDQPIQPDVIWLFRRPILDEWLERGDISLSDLVTHVYVHELAHHFGWSDDDIAAIDPWWE